MQYQWNGIDYPESCRQMEQAIRSKLVSNGGVADVLGNVTRGNKRVVFLVEIVKVYTPDEVKEYRLKDLYDLIVNERGK